MTNNREGSFTNNQGIEIFYRSWTPSGSPRASVLIVHGVNEHSGRYAELAEILAQDGFVCYALDHAGHGRSGGSRSYVERISFLVDDLITYSRMIEEWDPGIPRFILGHSMGAQVTTSLLIDHQDLFQGAVVSGTLTLVPEYVSDLTIAVGEILSKVMPKMGLISLELEALSRDPAVVQAYLDDPLVHSGKSSVRISSEMNVNITRIGKYASGIRLPILLLHGGADRIVDPDCSRFLHDQISSEDKQLIIYDNLYHEIYNEPEKETVFRDVRSWLNSHLSS